MSEVMSEVLGNSHGGSVPHLSERAVSLGNTGASLQMGLGVLGAVALSVGILVGLNGWLDVDPTFFWRSYLVSFCFILSMSLGGLFFVFVQHLTRAGWSVAVRRPAEILASNLRWIWLLWVVPFGWLFLKGQSGVLWPWSNPAEMKLHNPAEWHIIEKKIGYFSLFGLFDGDFFWARAIAYFAVWAFLAHYFLSRSLRLGATGDRRIIGSMQKVAAPAAILFALSVSFAAFDWIMSLSPAWFSTMFGVYFFTGCCTLGFAAIIVTCTQLQASGALVGVITKEHYQDLGKLLFAFGMVFWAYIGFSQYMLIWYANIPEETTWFLPRQAGGWGMLSFALLFGHFVIPFLGLISKWPKRNTAVLTFAALWMAAFGWLDLYWLIMPVVPTDVGTFTRISDFYAAHAGDTTRLLHPLHFCLLLGMVGLFGYFTLGALRKLPLVCERDPRLGDSLRFENI
ncbi:MAG: quinol:cytochrome C oxidoreductase [Phycisphaerae bacterium]|nr:quinol:cytochrome C oxidoreductase [Phycisphaerae bacterium]